MIDPGTRIGGPARMVNYLLLGLCALLALFPVLYMGIISMQSTAQAMDAGGGLLPGSMSDVASNYSSVLADDAINFPLYFRNTLLIAMLAVAGVVVSSAIAAYGFARVQWRGRQPLFIVMLATMMVPFPVVMVPLFVLFRELDWIGTFLPLWVPAWFGSAFSIFLLRQFFMTIPRELDDAMDAATSGS
jgi:multiple sugar transport system permease protein